MLQPRRGYLIAFEGIDGTGKSTQCRRLAEALAQQGFPLTALREPTHGFWGQKIRALLQEGRRNITPEEELSWFLNDRRENVERNILPALASKHIVLLDRYYYSTAAYQGALGLDPDAICRENETFAPPPDLVFIFCAPLEVCLERIQKSRGQADAFERGGYLRQVQDIFDRFTGPRFRRVDSAAPPESVSAFLQKEVDLLLARPNNSP